MPEEKSKMKDSVKFRISTKFERKEIPFQMPPSGKALDIKSYHQKDWVLMYFDKNLYDEINTLCKKHNLDTKGVFYGMFMKITKELEE
jgi:hypothetical protein